MNTSELTEFSANLADISETLMFALPVVAGLAGFLGLAALVVFSFIRQH